MTTSPGRDTSRQKQAGAAARAETRRRLLEAAGAEFAEVGYHRATVNRIAARAGVTVQTLYLAWGSKRALLRAHMSTALSGSPDTPYNEALPRLISDDLDPVDGDARSTVVQIAHLYRRIAERAALGWRLHRDATATEPDIAADWRELQRLRRDTFATLVRRIPTAALREGLDPEAAADTAWAIASPETHELLVETAGYTLDEYERWVAETLTAALLAP